jgi:serine/threonine protein kinase
MNAKTITCPPKEMLVDFGLGRLVLANAETISIHLEACAVCRQFVATISGDDFIDRLRNAQTGSQFAGEAVAPPELRPSAPIDSLDEQYAFPEWPSVTGPLPTPPELINHSDYELIKELGQGGMGTVYLARNRMMDRLEVLKVVSPSLLKRPGALERFQREIRAAAQLNHPNIVSAYSVLRLGDLLVLCMEYVDGQDLSQLVAHRGPLPVTNSTFYVHQVALGLQHAFEKGMVHRDIKPSNLIVSWVGKKHVIKILDFGLAKAGSEKTHDGGLTKVGQILGTPDYIAPEQMLDAQKADVRADIYSLGCTLYYLVSGRAPFAAESLYEVLHAHQNVEARPLNLIRSEVPAELATVVARMMAKSPADRYQTPGEVAKALTPFFKPSGTTDIPSKTDVPLPPMASVVIAPPVAIPVPPALPTSITPSPFAVAVAPPVEPIPPPLSPEGRDWQWRIAIPITVVLLTMTLGILIPVLLGVRSSDGRLDIEVNVANPQVLVDGHEVSVVWHAEGTKGELLIPAGSRQIELKKDGFETTTQVIEIEPNERFALTLRLESLKVDSPQQVSSPDDNSSGTAEKSNTGSSESARDYEIVTGSWRLESDQLVQNKSTTTSKLLIGNRSWTDYDFSTEAMLERGTEGVAFIFRAATADDYSLLHLGLHGNRFYEVGDVYKSTSRYRLPPVAGEFPLGVWQRVRIIVRGSSCRCWVNDKELFRYDNAGYTYSARGAIGFMTLRSVARFRNILVKAPDGTVLWQGLPEIRSSSTRTSSTKDN